MKNKNECATVKMIQRITVRIRSDRYLGCALFCMGVALFAKCCKKNGAALFFGQWAAPILLFGIYNKILKEAEPNRDQQADSIEEPEEKAFA